MAGKKSNQKWDEVVNHYNGLKHSFGVKTVPIKHVRWMLIGVGVRRDWDVTSAGGHTNLQVEITLSVNDYR